MERLTTFEERAVINAEIERLYNTSPVVMEDPPAPVTRGDRVSFSLRRSRLFKKLGVHNGLFSGQCRYCGSGAEFYMLRGDLWRRVVGVDPGRRCYDAGHVCLECVSHRLFPRQLYGSDFGGEGGVEIEEIWEDPETGDEYEFEYTLGFPNEGGAAVHVAYTSVSCSACASPDEPDDAWGKLRDLIDARLGWLRDYCRAHGLKLIIDGKEQE